MARRASNADPFDVWGPPPQAVLDAMNRNQQRQLQRYVERTAKKVYRLAYDLGGARVKELREERDARCVGCLVVTHLSRRERFSRISATKFDALQPTENDHAKDY